MDNKVKILIIFPLIFIIISVVITNVIHFEGELSENEQQTLKFTPSEIVLEQRKRIDAHTKSIHAKDLKGPIDFTLKNSGQGSFPPVSLDTVVPQPDYHDKIVLTFIVITGKSRMAVIEGAVVKEGDSIDGMKIAKIEPDRVLIKNKKSKWLYMKK